MSDVTRVLVMGLDGATFTVLRPLLARGVMPNLQRLIAGGIAGPLRSTIPPITAPAWTTFRTGVNPGKHGIFGFTRPAWVAGSDGRPRLEVRLNNAADVRRPSFWQLLSAAGMRVGISSLPFSFPPEPVGGFMVADRMTAGKGTGITYPPELQAELEDRLKLDFSRSPADGVSATDEYLGRLIHSVTQQRAMDGYLIETRRPELFVTVFQHTDTFQHVFWKHLDPTHPQHRAKDAGRFAPRIDRLFGEIDSSLGELIVRFQPQATIVMSDHGFQGIRRVVNVNLLLKERGLVKLRRGRGDDRPRLSTRRLMNMLARLDVLNLKRFLGRSARRALKKQLATWAVPAIDVEHSAAVFVSNNDMGIRLLCPPADADRVQREIADALCTLVDPATGGPVFDGLYLRQDVYSGKYVEQAPGVLFTCAPGYYPVADVGGTQTVIEDQASEAQSGAHALDGIFVAAGANIRSGAELAGARLVDLAPTILYLLGQPIPDEMDGRVLPIFPAAYLEAYPPRIVRVGDGASPLSLVGAKSLADEAAVLQRLSNLGYL